MLSMEHLVSAAATLNKSSDTQTETNYAAKPAEAVSTIKNNGEKKTEFSIQSIMHQDKKSKQEKKNETTDKKFVDSFLSTLNNDGKAYFDKLRDRFPEDTIYEILTLNQFSCMTSTLKEAVNKAALSKSFQEFLTLLGPSFSGSKSISQSFSKSSDTKKSFGFSGHQIDGILEKKLGKPEQSSSFLQFCNQLSGNIVNQAEINNKRSFSAVGESISTNNTPQTKTKVIPPSALKVFPRKQTDSSGKTTRTLSPSFQATSVIVESNNKKSTEGRASFNIPMMEPAQKVSGKSNSFQGNATSFTESEAAKLQQLHLQLSRQDEDGDTMLHIAVAQENIAAARSLISKMNIEGLNIRNAHGQTALHIACYLDVKDIVRDLIIHGTNVSLADDKGNTAMHIACDRNHNLVVEQMLQCYKKDPENYDKMFAMRNIEGLAAIHIATNHGNLIIVKTIIRYSTNLNIQEIKGGQTPLHLSLLQNKSDIAEALINAGVYVNLPNYTGIYPLSYAVQTKNVRLVECLLNYDADIGKSQDLDKVDSSNKEIKRLLEKESRRRRKRRKKENDGGI